MRAMAVRAVAMNAILSVLKSLFVIVGILIKGPTTEVTLWQ